MKRLDGLRRRVTRGATVAALRVVVALFGSVLFAGTAFAQPPDLSGRWSGQWVSDKNGHTGPLHARFRQLDQDTYRVIYHGRFAKVIPFRYATNMQVTGQGSDVLILDANRRLPLLGEYRSTATVTPGHFDATFTSGKDSGRFILNRR